MNLDALAPIIEQIIKDSLSANAYLYGKSKKRGNRVASGTLRNSIKADVVENKQGIAVIQITALNGKRLEDTYAYWLINDRKPGASGPGGKLQPAIEKWIEQKNSFTIKNFKTGATLPKNEKNIKSAAYVVARSIAKFGFKNRPMNFIEISFDKIMKDPRITEIVADATFEELFNKIEGL